MVERDKDDEDADNDEDDDEDDNIQNQAKPRTKPNQNASMIRCVTLWNSPVHPALDDAVLWPLCFLVVLVAALANRIC